MNITLEKTDAVHGSLTAVVDPADYIPAYNKALKQNAAAVNLPGFRRGKTPVAIVKKRFGKEILAETLNKTVSEALDKYIEDERVDILLAPIPDPSSALDSVEEGQTFTLKFTLALKPQFDFALSAADTLPYYDVEVADETVEQHMNMYRQRGGKFEKVDAYTDNDMVKGTLTELGSDGNALEGGLVVEDAIMLPHAFKDDAQKALFSGSKLGDVITLNPTTIYDGNDTEISSLLRITKEEAAQHKGDFQYQLTEITRYVPGELTQEIFDDVFPGKGVETEEAFREQIKQQLAGQYGKESDYRFLVDLNHYAKAKVGALTLPEDILRSQIKEKEGQSAEDADKDFSRQMESLKWELIVEKLAKQFNIKVEANDIVEAAQQQVRDQYARYGMVGIDEKIVMEGATQLLKDRNQIENVQFRCLNERVASAAKEVVTLEHKTISISDFNKLFEDAQ